MKPFLVSPPLNAKFAFVSENWKNPDKPAEGDCVFFDGYQKRSVPNRGKP